MTRLLPRSAAPFAVAALTVGGVLAAAPRLPGQDDGVYAVPAAGPVAVARADSFGTPDAGMTFGPSLPGGTFSPDGSFTPDGLPPGTVIEGDAGSFDGGTVYEGGTVYRNGAGPGASAQGFVAPQTFLPPSAGSPGDCGCDANTVFSPVAGEVPPLIAGPGCGAPRRPRRGAGGCAAGGCLGGGCAGGACTECDQFGRCAPGRYDRPLMLRRNNPVSGISFGYEFVFLRPRLPETDAFVLNLPDGAGGARIVNQDFDQDLEYGSRVWIETVYRAGFGLRFRWLGVDNDSPTQTFTNPGGGAVVTTPFFDSTVADQNVRSLYQVDLNVFDLEGTRRVNRYGWTVTSGGGLRGADLDQRYSAFRTGPGDDTAARSKASFDGFGPLVFAELRRPIGGTGFAFLALGRASLLYGEREQTTTVASPAGTVVTHVENDQIVPVGEIQLGGEYSFWVNEATVFFTHAAWETQVWQGVGNAFQRGDDFGLTGVNVALGLEW